MDIRLVEQDRAKLDVLVAVLVASLGCFSRPFLYLYSSSLDSVKDRIVSICMEA